MLDTSSSESQVLGKTVGSSMRAVPRAAEAEAYHWLRDARTLKHI